MNDTETKEAEDVVFGMIREHIFEGKNLDELEKLAIDGVSRAIVDYLKRKLKQN